MTTYGVHSHSGTQVTAVLENDAQGNPPSPPSLEKSKRSTHV